jgi:hypothetical protein
MIPVPTKFPILIISSARVGSNLLSMYYKKTYGIDMFLDLDGENGKIQEFIDYKKTSDRYVIKIHALHVPRYPKELIAELFEEDNFKIRLRRRDRVAQIASCYVANARKKWYYTEKMPSEDFHKKIDINNSDIDSEIKLIDEYYQAYDQVGLDFDADLWYEDLGDINNTAFVRTVLPINYDELLNTIKQRINDNGN